jgi:hypothetical protein
MSWHTSIRGIEESDGKFREVDNGILGTHRSSQPGTQFRAASKLEMGQASGWPLLSYLVI